MIELPLELFLSKKNKTKNPGTYTAFHFKIEYYSFICQIYLYFMRPVVV